MGSVFAIQVKTGFETKAKESLRQAFLRNGVSLVKGIFASETHTEVINSKSESINHDFSVTEEDISSHLKRERIRSMITNRRLQLEVIEGYSRDEFDPIKEEYRKEINQLERQVRDVSKGSKAIHSVLRGYLLIELNVDSTQLPAELWHIIKGTNDVISILSSDPIPKEEVENFFSNIGQATEPEITIGFEKEKTYEEIKREQTELLIELNKKETSSNVSKSKEIEEKLDNLSETIVEKVLSFVKNKPVNNVLEKVTAFIKRQRKMVTLPKSTFNILYNKEERGRIGKYLHKKDFIERFSELIHNNGRVANE